MTTTMVAPLEHHLEPVAIDVEPVAIDVEPVAIDVEPVATGDTDGTGDTDAADADRSAVMVLVMFVGVAALLTTYAVTKDSTWYVAVLVWCFASLVVVGRFEATATCAGKFYEAINFALMMIIVFAYFAG